MKKLKNYQCTKWLVFRVVVGLVNYWIILIK
jgi:hypothetical protein